MLSQSKKTVETHLENIMTAKISELKLQPRIQSVEGELRI